MSNETTPRRQLMVTGDAELGGRNCSLTITQHDPDGRWSVSDATGTVQEVASYGAACRAAAELAAEYAAPFLHNENPKANIDDPRWDRWKHGNAWRRVASTLGRTADEPMTLRAYVDQREYDLRGITNGGDTIEYSGTSWWVLKGHADQGNEILTEDEMEYALGPVLVSTPQGGVTLRTDGPTVLVAPGTPFSICIFRDPVSELLALHEPVVLTLSEARARQLV